MTSMDHNNVMSGIEGKLDSAKPPITNDCCIYKVPFDIRRLNEDAYTPKVVSIGPFHHNNSRVENMQRHKLLYCKKFLERVKSKSNLDLDTLIRRIEFSEPKIRHSYSDTLDLTPEKLVEVVLVDSCFIFELFLSYYYRDWSRDDDTLLLKPWLASNIRLDLFLLENQLPFFVLDILYTIAFDTFIVAGAFPSFLELTFHYFSYYNNCKIPSTINVPINHFTDLLRLFYLKPLEAWSHKKGRTNISTLPRLKSATELSDAGVTFMVNIKGNCLLDLTFSKKVLRIPKFIVEDWTEILFRNLIALEQCYYPDQSFFTDYVAVLDFLINTSKDVDVLVDKGILMNWLGDADSVVKLFNGLGKNITYVNFGEHYSDLCIELDAFCRDKCNHRMATLRRDYGKTPWQAAATFAAIIALILSFIQTVCSVIQVVQQARSNNEL